MISFQLVFFTTLAVNVYGQHILHSPVSFKYLENDFLNLNIVLENVPSDITQYLLHVRTDRHGLNISHITPKNGTHNVITKLNVKNVVLDLEIKNNGQTCAIFNILNGTQSTGVDGRSEFREQCLLPFGKNYCSIKVDFKNRCEDDSRLECVMKDETLTCFSGDIGQSEVAWSQHYIGPNDESSVGLPSTKVKGNSYMKMKMYKFDNNTQLSMKTEFSKKYYNVSVPLDKAEDYEMETSYIDENQTSYSFTCKGAESIISLLYDNRSKIKTYNRTFLNLTKPNELVNYSICCVQYKISNNIDDVIVERIVDQFTQIRIKPTQIQKTSTPNTTTSPLKPVSDNQDEAESSTGIGLYVILPTLLIVVILLLILGLYFKKRRNSSQSQQMLQLETYGTTEKVLYAELAIEPRNDTRVVVRTNESPYAEIIGVLHRHR